ncbi:hypothetical protein AB0M43_33640 [Longispora sp. NPDC051575]|uniref:hypothetical protein n=1 Tax=Longispora sp. NPDC051575 TaxID=3154943 RepID=UPI0034349770
MILPHTLTVFVSVEQLDPDGNPIRRPGTVAVDLASFVQADRADRAAEDGQASAEQLVAYVDGSADRLDAWAVAEYLGERYELLGPPTWHGDPEQTVAYWRIRLRRAR